MNDNDEWFPLAELTLRLGALVWVEEHLAEALALWSTVDEHAGAAVVFASTSGHHRWHAEITRHCLPTSPQLGATASIQAPTEGWRAAIETMQSLIAPDATPTRLKIVTRVVNPWIDREVRALSELAQPVSDAAMIRWLRFSTIDHADDHEAASYLLAARSEDAVRFDDHLLINQIDLTS